MGRGHPLWLCLLATFAASTGGCGHTEWQAELAPPEQARELDADAPFLKVHGHDGDLWVLEQWQVSVEQRTVTGLGMRYDAQRHETERGNVTIPFDDIALLETNRPMSVTSVGSVVLGVVTGVSLGMTAFCAVDPKACFGSCPTFYADAGQGEILQAEGFSASVGRAFEDTDVDSLEVVPRDGVVTVRMRNEALETHRVRSLRLLAVPVQDGGTALRSADGFHPAHRIAPAVACSADGADCLDEVAERDRRELSPRTDPDDLAARQTIELELPHPEGRAGIVVTARNSFVNTFLFYQVLAWMGRDVGEWMMALDDGASAEDAWQVMRDLQAMRIEVRGADGTWTELGVLDEMGPIATDRHLLLLPEDLPPGRVQVRIDMARGYWRIDRIALAEIGPAVEAVAISPREVRRDGARDDDALEALVGAEAYLTTYPGDEYELRFVAPPGPHAFFLESRGYYYEWMREQWLAEENPFELARFFTDTAGALRRLAPAFKRIEDDMERVFWQSRITRPLEER